MPTFLETLWSDLYAAEASRQYAAYASAGRPIADMSAEQIAAVGDAAAAFADAMVQATPTASLAALQTYIANLKP